VSSGEGRKRRREEGGNSQWPAHIVFSFALPVPPPVFLVSPYFQPIPSNFTSGLLPSSSATVAHPPTHPIIYCSLSLSSSLLTSFFFTGDARWSRAQLLGETARGHWGFTRAGCEDVIADTSAVWRGLDGRMVFAPVTEMTDETMRKSRIQMERMRRGFAEGEEENRAGGGADGGNDEDEEEVVEEQEAEEQEAQEAQEAAAAGEGAGVAVESGSDEMSDHD